MKFKCTECDFSTEDPLELMETWPEIQDLGARLQPGDQVPEGTCPICQAFVHQEKPDSARYLVVGIYRDNGQRWGERIAATSPAMAEQVVPSGVQVAGVVDIVAGTIVA